MQRKTIQVGNTEIDIFQQTDGSYCLGLEKIAREIEIEIPNLPQSLPQFFLCEGATEITEEIGTKLDLDRQEPIVKPEIAIALLQWQSMQGNQKALNFLNALFSVSLKQYLERSFEQPSSEKLEKDAMWQAYLISERDREEVYRRLANS